ncbi:MULTISPECIES: rhomboid family intramembrane serine protease [Sphingobacterium]|uniref:Rhomboid family intramembrane serine protease n=1 Tax=Sphingobacterium cellulitidis TaxID=1768011 RepID=A0A8H9FZ61_9SPHI|nr:MULTISPECIES: rhomboid family intramembrane serine protease [Sphingobacterium]MBA8985365.1 membrane associated rhomboid family serine protease [Sphingobacterium soli]WFB63787.1 rhomboid family intramembrane serine protease [Sphingobacterium sp. WM]GGE10230.1 rhomboid family intramembrane serine protease [Sphingobacterium soli]
MIQYYLTATPVASIIFALTIGLSIYVFSNPQWFGKLMLHPYSVYRDKSKWYLMLSSGLIHKDWMHLIFNMITFYYFGFGLEQIFVEISGPSGHLLFALLYIVALILSDIPTVLQQKNNYHYHSLGASGAISAVLFSYILFNPKMMLGIFMIIPMPAYIFAFVYLGYCIWASKNSNDGINHDAHLFGALSGLLFTIIAYPWVIKHFIDQF